MIEKETQNTNLASEFLVASHLFRLGYSVTVTFGHTKEVDLIVNIPGKGLITIDVKGLAGKTNWPILPKLIKDNHFYILVTYLNKFVDINTMPEFYIIPSSEIEQLITYWKNRSGITYKMLKGGKYKDAWHLLTVR
ncbi:MAG: hypothetical protein FJW69_06340 [Actinobacteria bacterium]|nr:hypothetical protein [Actinomycetota bacterium]MBM3712286.1 hypothetical protein [Actinomycetota bacterium]